MQKTPGGRTARAHTRANPSTRARTHTPKMRRASAIKYGEMQHAGVLVQDVQKAVEFYTKVLGMQDETHLRPNLPYDGIAIPQRVVSIPAAYSPPRFPGQLASTRATQPCTHARTNTHPTPPSL